MRNSEDVLSIILIQLRLECHADLIIFGRMVILNRNQSTLTPFNVTGTGTGAQTATDNQLHTAVTIQISDGRIGGLEHLGFACVTAQIVGNQRNLQILRKFRRRDAVISRIRTVDIGSRISLMCFQCSVLRHGHGNDQVIAEVLLQVAGSQRNNGGTGLTAGAGVGANVTADGNTGIQNTLAGKCDGLPQGKSVIIGGVDLNGVIAVVHSDIIGTVTIEITCGDIKQGIVILVKDLAGLIQCVDGTGIHLGRGNDVLAVCSVRILNEFDNLQISVGFRSIFTGRNIKLSHPIQFTAGGAVFLRSLIGTVQVILLLVVAADHSAITTGLAIGVAVVGTQIGPVTVFVLTIERIRANGLVAGPIGMVQIKIIPQDPSIVTGTVDIQIQLVLGSHCSVTRSEVLIIGSILIQGKPQSFKGCLINFAFFGFFRGMSNGSNACREQADEQRHYKQHAQ